MFIWAVITVLGHRNLPAIYCTYFWDILCAYILYMLGSKTENAQWANNTTRMRCGFRETATTRNFASGLFLMSHNAFWQFKKCHDAKFASWLLKKMSTTSFGIMKIPRRVVILIVQNKSVILIWFWLHISQVYLESTIHNHRCENLKSYKVYLAPRIHVIWKNWTYE
jgi:hypothetical protein